MKRIISKIQAFCFPVNIFGDFLISLIVVLISTSCMKIEHRGSNAENFPPDVAIGWIKMQQKLFVGTPGLLPHVTGRTYAYLGLTLYESIVPGMKGHQSISSQLNGNLVLPSVNSGQQ
jgi:hypothetical protein